MSDFDAVLERLLTDPGFKAALAADPARALAGYALAEDEVELLYTQVSADPGGEHRVERRTTKSGVFGLLGPLGGIGADAGFGAASDPGPGGVVEPLGAQGFGPGGRGVVGHNVGELPGGVGLGGFGAAGSGAAPGYRPNVDVDGDGTWDAYGVRAAADGGLELVADMDGDGRADFVGQDHDRDGLVDAAGYDSDRDGRFDTRLVDSDGDGWLDRTVVDPSPPDVRRPGSPG